MEAIFHLVGHFEMKVLHYKPVQAYMEDTKHKKLHISVLNA
jgi:hydroxymethylglutaryl-CoA reductase